MQAFRSELRATLGLAIPLGIGQLGNVALGAIATAAFARGGPRALAAGALGLVVFTTITILASGLFTAVTVLAARERSARRGVLRAALLVSVACTAIAIAVVTCAETLLVGLGQSRVVAHDAALFLHSAAWGLPCAIVSAALRAYAAGLGRGRVIAISTTAAWVSLLASTIVLVHSDTTAADVLRRVAVLFAGTHALATAILVVSLVSLEELRASEGHALAIVRYGLPVALMFGVESAFFSCVGLLAGRFGVAALAAHQIALQTCYLTFMVPSGIGMAAVARVAAATTVAEARRAGIVALVLSSAFMTVAAAVLLVAPKLVVRGFASADVDGTVAGIAVRLLRIAAAFQVLDGMQGVTAGALRGLGRSIHAFVASGLSFWIVGIPVGVVLAFHARWGVEGLWWGLAAGLAVAAASLAATFVRASSTAVSA